MPTSQFFPPAALNSALGGEKSMHLTPSLKLAGLSPTTSTRSLELETVESPMRKKAKLLFKLNFELGDGRNAKLYVREGDNFYRLAHNFVITYKLGEEAINKVWNLLEQTPLLNLLIETAFIVPLL